MAESIFLVNNAGVNPTMQSEEASLLTVQLETILATFTTNVLAVARITHAFLPLVRSQNYGRIVNVSPKMASLSSIDRSGDFKCMAV